MDMNVQFKVRIEILILIAIALFILGSHLLCSCSKVSPMEALTMAKGIKNKVVKNGITKKEAFQIAGNILSI